MLRSTIANGEILRKGQIYDLPINEANFLIALKKAEITKEKKNAGRNKRID